MVSESILHRFPSETYPVLSQCCWGGRRYGFCLNLDGIWTFVETMAVPRIHSSIARVRS